MPTKLEANASFKKPRLVFLVLAVALIFSAVFVGGVSGATTWYIPNDNRLTLAQVVTNATDGDTIVITENYVISEQVALSSNSDITITNAPGVDVTISGNADAGSLFKIDGGTLTVMGNDEGGSLTITTDLKGRAFDVNSGAALNIYDGVIVYQCGFGGASSDTYNGGAVYVNSSGNFIMYGGLLLNNTGYKGGAVYVDNGGYFELKKGKGIITNNHALDSYGGGVYAKNSDNVNWTGGDIKGNTALSKCDNNLNNIFPHVACPEAAPIYVGYRSGTFYYTKDDFWSVSEAYDWAVSQGKTFDIYILRNFTQGYIETWNEDSKSYTTKLDYVTISNDVTTVTLRPATQPVCLNIIDQMFYASGKYFTIGATGSSPSLTISGKNEVNTVDKGGFIYINGATSASIINCEISDTKAKEGGVVYIESGFCSLSSGTSINGCTSSDNGGAIYVEGGTLTLSDSSINGCTSSGNGGAVYIEGGTFSAWLSESIEGCTAKKGGAVYVEGGTFKFGDSNSGSGLIKDCTAEYGGAVYFADGTFTMQDNAKITGCTAEYGGAVYVGGSTFNVFNVMNGATIDSSNDVYLSKDKVITAVSGYYGTIENITLPSYIDGTEVVNVKTDSTGYPKKFILNPEGNDGIERILVLKEGIPDNYLVLKNNIEYQVIIPDELVIDETGNGTMEIKISVSGSSLPPSSIVKVYVSGDFILEHQANQEVTLAYVLSNETVTKLSNDDLVGTFTSENLNPIRLNATVSGPTLYSGTYTDTLTFTLD